MELRCTLYALELARDNYSLSNSKSRLDTIYPPLRGNKKTLSNFVERTHHKFKVTIYYSLTNLYYLWQ